MSRSPIDGGVVVVTGASSGIGADIARQLAERAQVVVVVARRLHRLEALAEALSGSTAQIDVRALDLTDDAACGSLIEHVTAAHGRVDVLVNNAGMGDFGLLESADANKIRWMIQVNVMAVTRLTQAVLPQMVARGSGGILNISSGFGVNFMPGFAAYVGTKHFVTGLTESLRTEVAGTGIRVVQVCPGPVATEFEAGVESPLDRSLPGWVEQSSAACASAAIAALDRNRALTVPGVVGWLLVHLGWWSPRMLTRGVLSLLGRLLRRELMQRRQR
ncbi:MAG: short-chain dehydrogenase [Deltaproteobacteria bacterium]|nr:short-chain dehydrogenase [Deltaproteobacteria bacterium]